MPELAEIVHVLGIMTSPEEILETIVGIFKQIAKPQASEPKEEGEAEVSAASASGGTKVEEKEEQNEPRPKQMSKVELKKNNEGDELVLADDDNDDDEEEEVLPFGPASYMVSRRFVQQSR